MLSAVFDCRLTNMMVYEYIYMYVYGFFIHIKCKFINLIPYLGGKYENMEIFLFSFMKIVLITKTFLKIKPIQCIIRTLQEV